MTPMRANSDRKPRDQSPSGAPGRARLNLVGDTAQGRQPGESAVFQAEAAASASFPAAARLEGGPLEGTVGAAPAPAGEGTYRPGSDALLSGAPLGQEPHRKAAAVKVRPNDLIAELREISGQVNRMMTQVDRAIHRLGIHAGEPLRR